MRQAGDCQEVTATVDRYGESYTASNPVSSDENVHLWEDQLKLPVSCSQSGIRAATLCGILQGTPFNEKGQGHEQVTYVGLDTFNSHGTRDGLRGESPRVTEPS